MDQQPGSGHPLGTVIDPPMRHVDGMAGENGGRRNLGLQRVQLAFFRLSLERLLPLLLKGLDHAPCPGPDGQGQVRSAPPTL